jgi:ATP-binding cassette subfamily B protein
MVRDADEIFVIDDGRIVERGNHEYLVESDGSYADFWRAQTGSIAAEGGIVMNK